MAELAAAAPFLSMGGSIVSAVGTIASGRAADAIGKAEQQRLFYAGEAAKTAAEYEAKQLDIHADEELAAASRERDQLRHERKLVESSLQAKSAAGGFSATDPTSLALLDEITKYGTLREQTAMYGGEAKQSALEAAAAGRRYSGESARYSSNLSGEIARATGRAQRNASYLSAAGTIMGGASTFAEKYAKGQPRPTVGRYG